MATRFYLPSSGAAAVTPSTWNHTNQAGTTYTLAGVRVKGATSLTSRTTASGITSPFTRAVMRYVIGPLNPVQISGTINIVMRCSEANVGANATLSTAVKLIKPDGTDRSVLLNAIASDLADSVQEFTATLGTRRAYDASEARPITLATQTPTAGDYLVIEIGFRSATTTTRNVVIQHGDNAASDCPDAEADTGANAPWAEFSGNVSLYTPITPTVVALTGSGVIPVVSQAYGINPSQGAVALSGLAGFNQSGLVTLAGGLVGSGISSKLDTGLISNIGSIVTQGNLSAIDSGIYPSVVSLSLAGLISLLVQQEIIQITPLIVEINLASDPPSLIISQQTFGFTPIVCELSTLSSSPELFLQELLTPLEGSLILLSCISRLGTSITVPVEVS